MMVMNRRILGRAWFLQMFLKFPYFGQQQLCTNKASRESKFASFPDGGNSDSHLQFLVTHTFFAEERLRFLFG
jgi:hypothetical protein